MCTERGFRCSRTSHFGQSVLCLQKYVDVTFKDNGLDVKTLVPKKSLSDLLAFKSIPVFKNPTRPEKVFSLISVKSKEQ